MAANLMSDEEMALWYRYTDKDRKAPEDEAALANRYRRLVFYCLNKLKFPPSHAEDMELVGMGALTKCIQRYRFKQTRSKFSSYAIKVINGNLLHYLRDKVFVIRGRTLFEAYVALQKAIALYATSYGCDPTTPEELAEFLGCSVEAVVQAYTSSHLNELTSLDAEDGDERSLWETVADPSQNIAALVEERLTGDYAKIADAMTRLKDERHRTILQLRYLKDYPQSRVAKVLGISQMHVSRLERRAMVLLKISLGVPITSTEEPEKEAEKAEQEKIEADHSRIARLLASFIESVKRKRKELGDVALPRNAGQKTKKEKKMAPESKTYKAQPPQAETLLLISYMMARDSLRKINHRHLQRERQLAHDLLQLHLMELVGENVITYAPDSEEIEYALGSCKQFMCVAPEGVELDRAPLLNWLLPEYTLRCNVAFDVELIGKTIAGKVANAGGQPPPIDRLPPPQSPPAPTAPSAPSAPAIMTPGKLLPGKVVVDPGSKLNELTANMIGCIVMILSRVPELGAHRVNLPELSTLAGRGKQSFGGVLPALEDWGYVRRPAYGTISRGATTKFVCKAGVGEAGLDLVQPLPTVYPYLWLEVGAAYDIRTILAQLKEYSDNPPTDEVAPETAKPEVTAPVATLPEAPPPVSVPEASLVRASEPTAVEPVSNGSAITFALLPEIMIPLAPENGNGTGSLRGDITIRHQFIDASTQQEELLQNILEQMRANRATVEQDVLTLEAAEAVLSRSLPRVVVPAS